MTSPHRAGFEPAPRPPKLPQPKQLPDTEMSGGELREVTTGQTKGEGRYTFESILVEGFLREGTCFRRIHSRESVTVFGYNEEHARAKAAREMARRFPWLSNDYSMLYLNGDTVSRRLLGQRLYKAQNHELVLSGTVAR